MFDPFANTRAIHVLDFPAMEPDQVIVDAAARNHVDIIFGTDRWVERLVELAGHHHIIVPPTEEQIEEEVAVVIQHFEHLHIHVGPEGVQGFGDLTDAG